MTDVTTEEKKQPVEEQQSTATQPAAETTEAAAPAASNTAEEDGHDEVGKKNPCTRRASAQARKQEEANRKLTVRACRKRSRP